MTGPTSITPNTHADPRIRDALRHDARDERVAALNALFRTGQAPEPPLNGRYWGEMVLIDVAPGLSGAMETMVQRGQPWLGKVFDAEAERGRNILNDGAYWPARLLWPFYRDYRPRDDTYEGFPFRTYPGPGLRDPDLAVLKLDYNVAANPRLWLSARRVLDEVVAIAPDRYLGKWYVRWYWGAWSLVGFFTLTPEQA